MTQTADQILTNAVIYTVDSARPSATALAIKDGTILAVGDVADIGQYQGPSTETRDMAGAFVMPGIVDVHTHHALAGRAELFELMFPVASSLDEILDAVRNYAKKLGPDEWLVGGRWASTLIPQIAPEEARHALDDAAGGRPVMLGDDSCHTRWVSSRALELAGITADTPDPAPGGGVIVRNPATREPTGLLLEAAGLTVERTMRAAQPMTLDQHAQISRRGIEILHSYGVTAFQDAGVSVDIMAALKSLDDAGDLHSWVVTSMLVNDPIFGFELIGDALVSRGEQYRTTHHRPDFLKIFLDGTPPTYTGAFLDPYLPDDDHGAGYLGETSLTPDELLGWLRKAAQAGLGVKIHCTGDASVRAVLDAVEAVRGEGHTDALFQVAHGQFVHPDDLPRFAELGVSADTSPFICVPGVIPDAIASVRPADHAHHMQPNRALVDSGAMVAGGSDWPVSESPHAFEGMQGMITRADPTGAHPGTLWPEQAVTLEEAIAAFTINSAKAMGIGGLTGSLTPGKSADYIVLDRNPFETPVTSLIDTRVTETVFGGTTVFTRN